MTINELVTAVNIALGSAPTSVCTAIDANSDGRAVVSELIRAVNGALSGCS